MKAIRYGAESAENGDPPRRRFARWALLACAAAALTLPSCEWDGNFTVLGYTTQPNYDCGIHTVRVPIFENRTFWKGLEFPLTEAVVREIKGKSPFRVVGPNENADTELTGSIRSFTKNTLNQNPLNEVREMETDLVVEVVWRDLRTGQVLSDPARLPPDQLTPPVLLPGQTPLVTVPGANAPGVNAPGIVSIPSAPIGAVAAGPVDTPATPGLPGVPKKPAPVVTITSQATFIPELGGSLATAEKKNVDRMAVQIVSMMEKPW